MEIATGNNRTAPATQRAAPGFSHYSHTAVPLIGTKKRI